jgi:hypothetical protein
LVRMRARVLFALSQLRLRSWESGLKQLNCLGSRLEFLSLQWRDVHVFVWVGVGDLVGVCNGGGRGGGEGGGEGGGGGGVRSAAGTVNARARQSMQQEQTGGEDHGSASRTGDRGKLSQG